MAFLGLNSLIQPILTNIVNQFVGPYTENIDTDALRANLYSGVASVSRVRLKKGVFDKFRLPVDVQEGYLGKLTIELPWQSWFNKPVKIIIEDMYILAGPAGGGTVDPEEDEMRAQAAKQERLKSAEALNLKIDDSKGDEVEKQGMAASFITKIVNNVQISVKNVHVRYEDKLSNPGHTFAAGVTLAGFTVVSTDGNWQPAFLESAKVAIHKLANLDSLAVYFDTDTESLAGSPPDEAIKNFVKLIARSTGETPSHQYILKPVSGTGKIIVNPRMDGQTPKVDVMLSFDEIGVSLDDSQYRNAISMVDMFHFFIRHSQYRKYRDFAEEQESRPRALLKFAGRAILGEVHDKNRRWSWQYFAQRREDRHAYVTLYKKKAVSSLSPDETEKIDGLERRLTYDDIRFYRSIADSHVRKDAAARRQLEERWHREHPERQNTGGWGAWLWGSGASHSGGQGAAQPRTLESLNEDERKELYEALEYDEKAYVAESFSTPREAIKLRIAADLNKGLFSLRSDPHGRAMDVVSVIFDSFHASFTQRPDNFEALAALSGFSVYDSTARGSSYHQIVRVKDEHSRAMSSGSSATGAAVDNEYESRFFYAKFEQNPLDERADSGLTVKMRYMEIVYHKEFVEAIYNFFRPPDSQLESVEALLDAASETIEGIRRETRAGLEYALQTHKTIDVKLDMNAPIIVIPEDITTTKCRHLLLDAGHISVESDLADKAVLKQIQQKRNQLYTAEDWKNLENHMYDKFSLKLQDAQFVIGPDLESSMKALRDDAQNMHLLERTNIDLSLQKSILPSAVHLSRLRVSGRLPLLKANFSDTKYKALMRFIEVSIPQLGDPSPPSQPRNQKASAPAFRLPPVFSPGAGEYTVTPFEDKDKDDDNGEEFFEASDGLPADIHQRSFELNFDVDQLEAAIAKSGRDGKEKVFGSVVLQHFGLAFGLAMYDMKVDVKLRSLSFDTFDANGVTKNLLSSRDSETKQERDLMTVTYKRVQKQSPEFMTVFEGVDQSVNVALSTFLVHAEPEPVITIYNFIMTTFTSNTTQPATGPVPPSTSRESIVHPEVVAPEPLPAQEQPMTSDQKLFVHVKLDSFQVILLNASTRLATLSLSAANVTVLINGPALRVNARLEDLSLTDDTLGDQDRSNVQLLSIEGKEVANFVYETYDVASQPTGDRINSSITFHAGALKFRFVEKPLHDIYAFLIKLARLKGLYDAATQAAVQRASEIEVQRMKFDISVQSPIIIFPWSTRGAEDVLVMKLGEIGASNRFESQENRITATLRGIQVASTLKHKGETSTLKLVDDVEIVANIVQPLDISRLEDSETPDSRISVKLSDIKLALTQTQYQFLMFLSQSIPRVFAVDSAAETPTPSTASPASLQRDESIMSTLPSTDLYPELVPSQSTGQVRKTLDVEVTVGAIKLHLYDSTATDVASLKTSGIARLALNDNVVRLKMLSNSAMQVEVILKSFTMGNTFPGPSRFREVIPAAQHERNQFMILYSTSGGQDNTAEAIITIDSPQIIFAVDPVFALLSFFTSTGDQVITSTSLTMDDAPGAAVPSQRSQTALDVTLRLHHLSISVLESDTDSETQAIELSIYQLYVSQKASLTVSIEKLGMSLTRMGRPAERVRFLDDLDATLSMANRGGAQQMTVLHVDVQPVVFRASYRDINLIQTIVNKAISLSTSSKAGKPKAGRAVSTNKSSSRRPSTKQSRALTPLTFSSANNTPQLLTTKEEVTADIKGFQLILISDEHETPIVDLKTKPFIAIAKDWSGELRASTTISTTIEYWNLTNSHWEPLLEPWTFSASVSKASPTSALDVKLTSRDRLEANVSSTAVELALATARALTSEDAHVLSKARGSDAPYKIRNRTGCTVHVWGPGSQETAKRLAHDDESDWRFDDWREMREHVSAAGRNHEIALRVDGKPWDALGGIRVDRESSVSYTMRTQGDRKKSDVQATRLLCEVTVVNNVKIVTLRSTYKIENKTLFPVEIAVGIDAQPYMTHKLAPGKDYALPIDAVTHTIRLRPDPGFGYAFSGAIQWSSLVNDPVQTITCMHESTVRNRSVQSSAREPPFNFHVWAQYDVNDPVARTYPKLTLKLHIPIELENLLPYDIDYRVFDKNTRHDWGSFLRKGGIMPVTSVQLSHLVLLSVKVQDQGFKPSEFSIINADNTSEFGIEKRLTVQDTQGRNLELRLNYVRHPDAGGAFRVQIYSPYVLLNKTGLPYAARTARTGSGSVFGDNSSANPADAKPILLSHPAKKGHEFCFQVGNSVWSKPINVDAPNAEAKLDIPSSNQLSEYNLGISWVEGSGKYKLSKVITLAPRFILKNLVGQPISFREHGADTMSNVQPDERGNAMVFRPISDPLLTFAYPGLNAQWSAPINVANIGTVHVRMKPADPTGELHLLRAEVMLEGATIFIMLHRETGPWPFTIENHSQVPIKYAQVDEDYPVVQSNSQGRQPRPIYALPAKAAQDYAWDFPAPPGKKLSLLIGGRTHDVDLGDIGNHPPLEFSWNEWRGRGRPAVSLDIRADGKRQVLTISDFNEAESDYRRRTISNAGTISRQNSTSTLATYEVKAQPEVPTFTFSLDFDGLGLSLLNKRLVEVVYFTLKGLRVNYTQSETSQAVEFICKSIQVDNQLQEALFPVVLEPTPRPLKNGATEQPAFIQFSLNLVNDAAHGVMMAPFASFLLQAVTVQLDEDFLFAVYDLTKLKGLSWEEEEESILIRNDGPIPDPSPQPNVGTNIFFGVLDLHPMELHISFARTNRVNADEKFNTNNPLAYALNVLTMTIGNINDAVLRMNALKISEMRLTLPELEKHIFIHYRQDALRQIYRILFAADVIGNPVGLWTNVSSGVKDFFYEPYTATFHGNMDLGAGIAKGTASLMKKTVFGVSDTVSKFTGSVGKGLSAATLDADFQNRRMVQQRRNKPQHVLYGVTAGAEALFTGVKSGAQGLVMKPIQGAETGGPLGLVKGVGQGVLGLVTKPLVGAFDFASNVSEGVRNTTTVFDNPKRSRERLPRLIPANGILRSFSQREAYGQYLMRDLEQGRYKNEYYIAHIELPDDTIALLTQTRVMAFHPRRLTLLWDLAFAEVRAVNIEPTGILFKSKRGEGRDQFVHCSKTTTRNWFFDQVAQVVRDFNARKHVEK